MILQWLFLIALIICISDDSFARGKPWLRFENCRLLPNESNDGDSFHVQANGRHYIFRLYSVDAPETDARYGDRVKTQAKYFGLTIDETLQVGQEAERFTQKTLSQRTFTVVTNKSVAPGESKKTRYYAFVLMNDKDLGGELVANGLARVYGRKAKRPDDTPIGAQRSRLKRLEEIAKIQRVGAWGFRSGGLHKRVQSREQFDSESFDRFFHPEKFRSPPPTVTPRR